MRFVLLLAALLISHTGFAADYVQAKGSTLTFAGTYQGEVFVGRFPDFNTTLSFDPAKPADAKLDVVIQMASVKADNSDYDSEMRGTAFFDTKKFTQARFTAQGFRALGGNRFRANGTLTLRGKSQPVTLDIQWTPGTRPVLEAKASVKRLAFGIGLGDWADTSLIADAIAVSTRVLLQPKPAK